MLLFYSDGITEAANREGKFFGTGRLRDLFAANTHMNSAELADKILEEVQEFTQGGAITDDRTLVVMKVK
jgi:sigma-B regulation protein RsbU (phosphoserine phosphatase)